MLTNFSGPQKVLVILSALLTLCYLGLVGYALFSQNAFSNVNIPIPSLANSGFDISLENVEAKQITIAKSEAEISVTALTLAKWQNNTGLLLNGSKLTINSDSVSLTSGAGLFNISEQISVSGWQLNNAIFAIFNNQLYLFAGNAAKGQIAIKSGNKVALATDAAGNITRREVINLNELAELRRNANLISQNIEWLTDITAPKLLSISPIPNATLFDAQVSVSGEIDDRFAEIEINSATVSNQEGKFSTEIVLAEGENTIIIRLSDIYGNTEVTELVVTYEKP